MGVGVRRKLDGGGTWGGAGKELTGVSGGR
jgi:hypothetical protein